jgi:hypothetical protein
MWTDLRGRRCQVGSHLAALAGGNLDSAKNWVASTIQNEGRDIEASRPAVFALLFSFEKTNALDRERKFWGGYYERNTN